MKNIYILSIIIFSLQFFSCQKEIILNDNANNHHFINDLSSSKNSFDYLLLLKELKNPHDIIFHYQDFQTYGNDMIGGTSNQSFSASINSEDNYGIKLLVNEKLVDESENNSVYIQYKDNFEFNLGESSIKILDNENNILVNSELQIPKAPKFLNVDGYISGYGFDWNLSNSFSLNWDTDNSNNDLNACVIQLSAEGSNYVVYVLTDDDGSYVISSELFSEFTNFKEIEIALIRGTIKTFDIEINEISNKVLFYSILHNNLHLNVINN